MRGGWLTAVILLALAPGARAEEPLDLSHVAVGQIYHWTLPNGVAQRWSITAVGAARVDYTVTTLLDTGEGPQPVGEPLTQTWEASSLTPELLPEAPADGERELPRDTVVISGHRFECLVAVAERMRAVTWIPVQGDRPLFPPLVKSTLDGASVMELSRIEPRGPLPPSEDTASLAPPTDQAAPEGVAGAGADLRHVKAGQVYVYEMMNNMRGEWTVLEVAPNQVRYRMTILMDMGQGLQPIGEPNEQLWEYRPQQPGDRAWQQQPGAKTRREQRVVDGVAFDCLVLESSGWTSWVTMTPGSESITTFPGLVESSDGEGRSTMKLVEVRQP